MEKEGGEQVEKMRFKHNAKEWAMGRDLPQPVGGIDGEDEMENHKNFGLEIFLFRLKKDRERKEKRHSK